MPYGQQSYFFYNLVITIILTNPITNYRAGFFYREAIDSFCSAKVGRTKVRVSPCGACRGEALCEDGSVAKDKYQDVFLAN